MTATGLVQPISDSDYGPGMTSVEITRPDGARVVAEHRERPGRPLVLLHGLAGHRDEWEPLLAELGQPHSVALDLRGHGSSTARVTDVSRRAYVDDVIGMLAHLDLGPVDLIGQSFGAHTALLVAADRPDLVERLVLVEGGLGGEGPEATAPIDRWLHSWPERFVDRAGFVAFFGGDGPVAAGWWAGLPGGSRPWDADVLTRALAEVHRLEATAAWESVSAPTLLLTGEHGAVPAEQITRMVRTGHDVRHRVLPDGGHDLHLELPRSVATRAARHLRD